MVILIIDVEGQDPDIVEITILVYNNYQIIDIFHDYAIPTNEITHNLTASFCHCIPYSSLIKVTKNSPSHLLEKARVFASQYIPATVISNDKVCNSDIFHIINKWNLNLTYQIHYLGDWIYRIHQPSHQLSRFAKFFHTPICTTTCHLHTLSLFHQKPTATNIAKESHGAHCSLYDSYELFLSLICRDNSGISLTSQNMPNGEL